MLSYLFRLLEILLTLDPDAGVSSAGEDLEQYEHYQRKGGVAETADGYECAYSPFRLLST
jgi:hypothetical protein